MTTETKPWHVTCDPNGDNLSVSDDNMGPVISGCGCCGSPSVGGDVEAVCNLLRQAPVAAAEIARLQAQLAASQALVAELADALRELVSTVRGECPSLLNEDSGGSPELSFRVDDALAKAGRPTAPAKADASAAVRESHDAALASASSVIYPKD